MTSTRPDQSSGVSVHSIPAWWPWAMLMKRLLRSVLVRPARSRKRSVRDRTALRMSYSWR